MSSSNNAEEAPAQVSSLPDRFSRFIELTKELNNVVEQTRKRLEHDNSTGSPTGSQQMDRMIMEFDKHFMEPVLGASLIALQSQNIKAIPEINPTLHSLRLQQDSEPEPETEPKPEPDLERTRDEGAGGGERSDRKGKQIERGKHKKGFADHVAARSMQESKVKGKKKPNVDNKNIMEHGENFAPEILEAKAEMELGKIEIEIATTGKLIAACLDKPIVKSNKAAHPDYAQRVAVFYGRSKAKSNKTAQSNYSGQGTASHGKSEAKSNKTAQSDYSGQGTASLGKSEAKSSKTAQSDYSGQGMESYGKSIAHSPTEDEVEKIQDIDSPSEVELEKIQDIDSLSEADKENILHIAKRLRAILAVSYHHDQVKYDDVSKEILMLQVIIDATSSLADSIAEERAREIETIAGAEVLLAKYRDEEEAKAKESEAKPETAPDDVNRISAKSGEDFPAKLLRKKIAVLEKALETLKIRLKSVDEVVLATDRLKKLKDQDMVQAQAKAEALEKAKAQTKKSKASDNGEGVDRKADEKESSGDDEETHTDTKKSKPQKKNRSKKSKKKKHGK